MCDMMLALFLCRSVIVYVTLSFRVVHSHLSLCCLISVPLFANDCPCTLVGPLAASTTLEAIIATFVGMSVASKVATGNVCHCNFVCKEMCIVMLFV